MKNVTAALIIILVFSIFAACGSDSPYIPPVVDPPPVVIQNTVDFSCASVDNDQSCSGILDEPGVWNSGPVQTTGSPMPVDYLNMEITNNMAVNASMFAVANITISGCSDDTLAFNVVDLGPGTVATITYQIWNYICGGLGYQASEIFLYNATSFDPTNMHPVNYPRTDLITNAVVIWDNRLPGDMP